MVLNTSGAIRNIAHRWSLTKNPTLITMRMYPRKVAGPSHRCCPLR